MREYYLAIYYDDDCNLQQVNFGNPVAFEQGLHELRKRAIKFDAFIVQIKDDDRIKLLPWS